MKYSGKNAKFFDVHTVDMKTVTPALRQTVTAISKTNTQCTVFKQGSFNIKRLHQVALHDVNTLFCTAELLRKFCLKFVRQLCLVDFILL